LISKPSKRAYDQSVVSGGKEGKGGKQNERGHTSDEVKADIKPPHG